MEISAYLGHVGLVDLLATQPGPLMKTQRATLLGNALRNAAQNGHLPVMRLLRTLGAVLGLAHVVCGGHVWMRFKPMKPIIEFLNRYDHTIPYVITMCTHHIGQFNLRRVVVSVSGEGGMGSVVLGRILNLRFLISVAESTARMERDPSR